MQSIIFIIHILIAIAIIALVLVQHGKGSDIGAAFGSGASQTIFGAQSSLPFFVKLTALLAAIFVATSLFLGHYIAKEAKEGARIIIPTPVNTNLPQSPK